MYIEKKNNLASHHLLMGIFVNRNAVTNLNLELFSDNIKDRPSFFQTFNCSCKHLTSPFGGALLKADDSSPFHGKFWFQMYHTNDKPIYWRYENDYAVIMSLNYQSLRADYLSCIPERCLSFKLRVLSNHSKDDFFLKLKHVYFCS